MKKTKTETQITLLELTGVSSIDNKPFSIYLKIASIVAIYEFRDANRPSLRTSIEYGPHQDYACVIETVPEIIKALEKTQASIARVAKENKQNIFMLLKK